MSDHRVTELERWFLLVLLIVLAFTYLPLLPKLSNHRPRQARPARKTS